MLDDDDDELVDTDEFDDKFVRVDVEVVVGNDDSAGVVVVFDDIHFRLSFSIAVFGFSSLLFF